MGLDLVQPTVEDLFYLKIEDLFYLKIRECAMDWRTQFAGSRGERVSWVAGVAYSCISLVLFVVMKTSHFTAIRWAEKITAV